MMLNKIQPMDFAQIALAFSKANILDRGSFTELAEFYMKSKEFKENVSHLDICQLLTIAKAQDLTFDNSQAFWEEIAVHLKNTLS